MSESCITVEEIDCNNAVLVTETPTTVIDTTDPVVIIAACQQGPAGADGADGTGLVEASVTGVNNGNTVTVDDVPVGTNRSVKWIITLTDTIAGDYKTYEVLAVHNGTTAMHTVYGLVGDVIAVTTNVDINAGNMRLRVTNDSTNALDIKAVRIATTV
jgi:hypothetical protein